MASTNFTTHYSIPLPLGTDLTTPMDYNEAAEAIDTALFGAVTDASNASEAAGEAVNTANAASEAAEDVRADLSLEKAKIVQLQTRMTAAENDIDDVYTDVTDMITAFKEPSATSTHAYAIGDYFIYNETLYKATAAIAIGATIVPNTNCEATNVASELIQINNDLSTKTMTFNNSIVPVFFIRGLGILLYIPKPINSTVRTVNLTSIEIFDESGWVTGFTQGQVTTNALGSTSVYIIAPSEYNQDAYIGDVMLSHISGTVTYS